MAIVDILKDIVGPGGWTADQDALEPHLSEWRDIWRGRTPLMVSPDTTARVAAVVRACHENQTAIVPQGGNTGLCGGAIPDTSGEQILLSLGRLNRIRSSNADDHSIVAEAGCTLVAVQEAAAKIDRFFPLSLAAEGSCQIGGNLSTNAGGINVLRYGTARQLALGLEVVLADGTVWDGLRSLRKDTSGYDLKQVFIGAEGTLGVITAASLRLFPKVANPQTALLSIGDPHVAIKILGYLRRRLGDQVQAFELIPDLAIRFVVRHIPGVRFPLSETAPWYLLVEAESSGGQEMLETALQECLERSFISDAIVAKNRAEAEALWRIRHAVSEAQKKEGASLKHDISVPVGSVAAFIDKATEAVQMYMPGIRPVTFGHVGDGNIHFNLSQPEGWDAQRYLRNREALATVVYDVVDGFDGSISAEHGIGQAKTEQLRHYRGDVEVGLMRSLKTALDPLNIMNPGKVI